MDRTELKKNLKDRLKTITTYEEFKSIQDEMEKNNFAFFGKRRDILISGFSQGINTQKISYLYDDGNSTGKCYIKNFYKVANIDDYYWNRANAVKLNL